MTNHTMYAEVRQLIEANQPILLVGEAGSGKTTLAKQIADDLELPFHSMSMTRQTTLSHLMGFLSVNGTYIPSALRRCFENGGLMLLDEIDAGDPNVLLSLNTIENGYISFPDALVNCHSDFRLVATSNPPDQHNSYTGRSKLDAATLDRYDIVDVSRDDSLEKTLVDEDTHQRMQLLRKIMSSNNSSKRVSMRDSIRYQKRKNMNLLGDSFIYRLTDKSDLIFEQYVQQVGEMPKHQDQSECHTFEELSDLLTVRAGGKVSTKSKRDEDSKPTYSDPYGTDKPAQDQPYEEPIPTPPPTDSGA